MWRNRIQKNGTYRFPLIVEALACLRSRSCIVDAEAVACGNDGIGLSTTSGTNATTRRDIRVG
jgi:hypothetical protein